MCSSDLVYGATLVTTKNNLRFVQLYDLARPANLGTDQPLATVPVPPSGYIAFGSDLALRFETGVTIAITTDNATVPATAASSGDVQGFIAWDAPATASPAKSPPGCARAAAAAPEMASAAST